jgi:ferrous iron transport protein B
MLTQALGTNHLDTVLTFAQMLTFTVFVMLYTPCIATLAIMKKVVGTKQALLIMLISIIVATVIAISTRFFVSLSFGG